MSNDYEIIKNILNISSCMKFGLVHRGVLLIPDKEAA